MITEIKKINKIVFQNFNEYKREFDEEIMNVVYYDCSNVKLTYKEKEKIFQIVQK